jgi:hypothetical protein
MWLETTNCGTTRYQCLRCIQIVVSKCDIEWRPTATVSLINLGTVPTEQPNHISPIVLCREVQRSIAVTIVAQPIDTGATSLDENGCNLSQIKESCKR